MTFLSMKCPDLRRQMGDVSRAAPFGITSESDPKLDMRVDPEQSHDACCLAVANDGGDTRGGAACKKCETFSLIQNCAGQNRLRYRDPGALPENAVGRSRACRYIRTASHSLQKGSFQAEVTSYDVIVSASLSVVTICRELRQTTSSSAADGSEDGLYFCCFGVGVQSSPNMAAYI